MSAVLKWSILFVFVFSPCVAIYGGIESTAPNFYVAITTITNDIPICNGVLLASNLILTTASCIAKPHIQDGGLAVRMGSGDTEENIPVARIVYHDKFNNKRIQGKALFDLAVMTLDILPNTTLFYGLSSFPSVTTGSSNIATTNQDYRLIRGTPDPELAPILIASGRQDDVLMTQDKAPRSLLPDVQGPVWCKSEYAAVVDQNLNETEYNTASFLCSNNNGTAYATSRDEGGLLYTNKVSNQNGVRIHGLVNAAIHEGTTYYTRLSRYRKWILTKIRKLGYQP